MSDGMTSTPQRACSRQRRDPALVHKGPEVHRLPAHQDQVSIQVRQPCQDRPDVDVTEIAHSSGFEPRELIRTRGNAK
jgi:hypothetical protein